MWMVCNGFPHRLHAVCRRVDERRVRRTNKFAGVCGFSAAEIFMEVCRRSLSPPSSNWRCQSLSTNIYIICMRDKQNTHNVRYARILREVMGRMRAKSLGKWSRNTYLGVRFRLRNSLCVHFRAFCHFSCRT